MFISVFLLHSLLDSQSRRTLHLISSEFLLTGTGVVILAPTRELAMQTYGVLKELMTHHVHTYGLIMGGSNRSAEAQKLANGVNILVATPGRLLDHLQVSGDYILTSLYLQSYGSSTKHTSDVEYMFFSRFSFFANPDEC